MKMLWFRQDMIIETDLISWTYFHPFILHVLPLHSLKSVSHEPVLEFCDIERDEERVRTGVRQVVDHDGVLRERWAILGPDEVDQVLIGQLHLHPLACITTKDTERGDGCSKTEN